MSSASPTGVSSTPSALSISADERLLLCSLIETQQFGPAVKAIFDRQWYTNGEYQYILSESVAAKQAQIKQICEEHYAEFLAGIEHLLSVKLDLSELRSLAQSLNLSVQQSGRAVLASARQLNEQRRLRYQINSAKQILQSCASLIALARKAKQQIHHSKYFSALKTLNQLQRILHLAATNFHRTNAQPAAAANATPVPLSPTATKVAQAASASAAASSVRFEFIRQLERQIPLLTGKIKESVKGEFTTWLGGISKRSRALGELALAQLDEHLTAATRRAQARREEATEKRARQASRRVRKAASSTVLEEDDDEEDADDDALDAAGLTAATHTSAGLFDAMPINFTPIYQCLHIYEHLNLAEQFQLLYKEKRQNQLMEAVHSLTALGGGGHTPASSPRTNGGGVASPVTPSSPASARDIIDAYSTVFASVTGFFIIEDNILKSGNELISRAEIDTMYEKVQLALIGHLAHHFHVCAAHSAASVLQLKYVTVLFCKLMDENFLGHDSALLRKFLEEQRPRFEEVLLRRVHQEVRNIFAKEKWEPLGINDHDEYDLFVLGFGLQEESINVDFPCTMPFSISVPLVCRILCNFIDDYFQYARYLEDGGGNGGSGSAAIDAAVLGGGGSGSVSSSWKGHVLRAVDRAMNDEINRTFTDLLRGGPMNLPISQTVQFSINAQVFSELTCTFLENLVERYGEEDPDESLSGAPSTTIPSPSSYSLRSRQMLLSTKLRCEDLIFELIASKIDEFLDLTSVFAWTPDAPQSGPSEYMLDLIAYLETTFFHMSFMPDAVREAVHFTSCKRIADTIMETIAGSDSNCKKFNIIAIVNLNQDLHVVEAFAQRCPIQNLVETFSEIRQVRKSTTRQDNCICAIDFGSLLTMFLVRPTLLFSPLLSWWISSCPATSRSSSTTMRARTSILTSRRTSLCACLTSLRTSACSRPACPSTRSSSERTLRPSSSNSRGGTEDHCNNDDDHHQPQKAQTEATTHRMFENTKGDIVAARPADQPRVALFDSQLRQCQTPPTLFEFTIRPSLSLSACIDGTGFRFSSFLASLPVAPFGLHL